MVSNSADIVEGINQEMTPIYPLLNFILFYAVSLYCLNIFYLLLIMVISNLTLIYIAIQHTIELDSTKLRRYNRP